MTTIKWVAGITFAIAVYLGQKGLDAKDGGLISYALLPLILAACIAGFVAVHTRGTVAVYGLGFAVVHQFEINFGTCIKIPSLRARWLVRNRSRYSERLKS